ncbi:MULTISPECIES: MarR family transcriptional regulator [Nocardia]|uniref:MarR family transcriptional regulator n=1 Tax=Nocardia sputorum TaxID=2984338 RepID=A0ABN6U0W1_9NOCA|nr:helix-turn-helix domain-containing protein [Nocardia sputorum]BDT98822.1 hypothetical protein IFM12276_18510 [Nocardia sputorum]
MDALPQRIPGAHEYPAGTAERPAVELIRRTAVALAQWADTDAEGLTVDAEAAVLGVLAPGGMLTADQISREAQLTRWSTRRVIGQLESRGLIMATAHGSRWSVTPRGRAAWATKFRRFAQ